MLIRQYRPKLVRPPNPSARHLRCFAQLDGDLRQVLPYLNTVLKGQQFSLEPPSLTLKYGGGKLITLTPREVAINIVKDEAEALEILEWLKQKINATWEHRGEITPSFQVAAPPRVLEILKLLPRHNCRACGQPTCLVFAVQVGQGAQELSKCPALDPENRKKLQEYLGQFHLCG